MNRFEILFFVFVGFYLITPLILGIGGTVDFEERYAGGFYEPIQVVDIEEKKGLLLPVFNSPSDGYSRAKVIGSKNIFFIFQEEFPHLKIRILNKTFPFLPRIHIGPIPIFFQRFFMTIFSKSALSIRISTAILSFLFLLSFYHFLKKMGVERKIAILSILFLLFHPASKRHTHEMIVYISFVLLLNHLLGEKSGIFLTGILTGLILHSNLLVGGACVFSIFLSYFLTISDKKMDYKKMVISFLIIIPFLLPFGVYLLFHSQDMFKRVYPHSFSLSLHLELLKTMLRNLFYIIFIPYKETLEIGGLSTQIYIFIFSSLTGIILITGAFTGILRSGKTGRFLFLFIIFFITFGTIRITRPHHYILVLFVLIILFSIQKSRLVPYGLGIGIILLFISNLFLSSVFLNSAYNIKIHKEIGKFLKEKEINSPHLMAGPFGYELLTNGYVRAIDFSIFISKNPQKLHLTVLMSKGKHIILREERKLTGIEPWLTLDELRKLAEKNGMGVELVKAFPYSGGAFYIVKIE